jgi:mRNA-degrading endonuclease RelE of RelBE toxin-antitoxin system
LRQAWPRVHRAATIMYAIQYVESVAGDLAGLRAFDRKQILDEIEEQLTHQPACETKRRKILRGLTPPWEHVEPVWELRVDEFRVFYDVDETASRVTVRAVKHKPAHKTTEEIL